MHRKHGITPAVADDALADANRIVIDPDYNSTSNRSVRIIGYSILADDIITVIALEHDGVEYGVNGWPANLKDPPHLPRRDLDRRKESVMSKTIDDLLAAESKAVEDSEATSDPNAPLPPHVKITRGHPRTRNLQVRFRDDEFEDLTAYAEQRGLPVSTVVRALVLQAIAPADDLKAALDKLETDLAAIRRKALSA